MNTRSYFFEDMQITPSSQRGSFRYAFGVKKADGSALSSLPLFLLARLFPCLSLPKKLINFPPATGCVFFNINPASGRPGAECNGYFHRKKNDSCKEGAGDIRL